MAQFSVNGMQGLQTAFTTASNYPQDVKINCLKAMGETAKKAEAASAENEGVDDTHAMIDSLYVKKPELSDSGGSVIVTFRGSRTDKKHKTPTRNAEIAFINEFGKEGQEAKQFISKALTHNKDKILDAGQEVLNQWVDSKY